MAMIYYTLSDGTTFIHVLATNHPEPDPEPKPPGKYDELWNLLNELVLDPDADGNTRFMP